MPNKKTRSSRCPRINWRKESTCSFVNVGRCGCRLRFGAIVKSTTFRVISALTTHGGSQYSTCLRKPRWGKPGHSAAEHFSWKRMYIVEVDDAVSWDAVSIRAQVKLGYQPAVGASERRHNHGSDSGSDRITRKHQHWTVPARCRREPDLTALHRSNQTTPRLAPSRRSPRASAHLLPADT